MSLVRDVLLDPGRRYFDAHAPDRIRRRIARQSFWMCAVVSVLCGALTALFVQDLAWLPAALAAYGLATCLIHRLLAHVPRATVHCRRCPGAGWIDDLRAHGGTCPRCGNTRFDYRGFRFTGATTPMPLHVDDVSGEWLLDQQHSSRHRRHYR